MLYATQFSRETKMNRYKYTLVGLLFVDFMSMHSAFAGCVKNEKYGQICEYHIPINWWIGSWISEETDQCGNDLISLVYINSDGTFRKHLVSEDHSTRDVWGTYKITYALSGNIDGKEYVPEHRMEINYLHNLITKRAKYDREVRNYYRYFSRSTAVSSYYPQSGLITAYSGKISFAVKGRFPSDYEPGNEQTYSFITQGPGYINITGPGATETLMRKYSNTFAESANIR
jgi:hypothetical protein